jgi:hypothetical protein
LTGIVLHDNLSPAPSGRARVRVIQAASRAPHATVVAGGGATLARDVTFATSTKYTTVPAGNFVLNASAVGRPSVHASSRVKFAADTVHTVVVLDGKGGGITIRALDDAAGAAVAPVGAVPGGGGGTAGQPGAGRNWVWDALAGLVAIIGTALALTFRRRAGRRIGTP